MRANFLLIIAATLSFAVAGCDNSTPDASEDASSLPELQNAPVDADPTPDTGTGGPSEAKSPDGTTNAPAAQ